MINELIIAGVSFFHPQANQDSLGVETINGKIFIVHKVDEKETLYAIARRYGASVDAIRTSNPGLTTTLEVGQIIKVPYVTKSVATKEGTATHKVAPGETMYSISKAFSVSVDDIRKWNNLTDNNLSIGQELIVKRPSIQPTSDRVASTTRTNDTGTTRVPPGGMHTVATRETMYSIARQYGVSVGQIRTWNSLSTDELQVGQSIFVTAPPANHAVNSNNENRNLPVTVKETDVVKSSSSQPKTEQQPKAQESAQRAQQTASTTAKQPQTIRISESLKNSDEITEAGVAELIEGTEGNRKYLALHRTAPVGTILKVRNEMNNREVFVRVMGKLTDSTDKTVIKISRSAYDRLGAIDPRFRVELTYYK
jgi:LysM repeat protein